MARLLQVTLRPALYKAAVAFVLIPGMLSLALFILWALTGSPGIHAGSVSIPYGLLILPCALYYVASCFFVRTNEFAGVTVLEIPVIECTAGFVFVPLWLAELHRLPRAEQADQFPAEPEKISNLPDEEADRIKSTLLEPIRITTGGPEVGEEAEKFKGDLLNERLTLEPTIVVHWQVEFDAMTSDGYAGFFNFYVNMPGNTWSAKYHGVLKRMRDTSEGVLNSELSKHSAGWAIANKDKLVQMVFDELAEAVSEWGINVYQVQILNLVPHRSVNVALGTIPEAKAQGEAKVISAANEKTAMISLAEGKKQVTILEDQGEGEGLKAFADASGVPAIEKLRIDAAIEIGKNGKNINIGDGLIKAAENMVGALK